jgi:hypothetical protein
MVATSDPNLPLDESRHSIKASPLAASAKPIDRFIGEILLQLNAIGPPSQGSVIQITKSRFSVGLCGVLRHFPGRVRAPLQLPVLV